MWRWPNLLYDTRFFVRICDYSFGDATVVRFSTKGVVHDFYFTFCLIIEVMAMGEFVSLTGSLVSSSDRGSLVVIICLNCECQ